ncbi:MAG TPA: hypothetical protein EYP49_11180 [Anaerolineae bacterium]|nr:hypothetical protein [Anaerolineae bacterium]
MTVTLVTVQIPQPLYHRLERAAVRLQKPVEDLLTETLQAALPPTDEISASIQAEIATLDGFDDAKLRNVAESEMAVKNQQTLDRLLDLQSMRPLTDDEAARLEGLRADYGRILLRKARAFALLAEH